MEIESISSAPATVQMPPPVETASSVPPEEAPVSAVPQSAIDIIA